MSGFKSSWGWRGAIPNPESMKTYDTCASGLHVHKADSDPISPTPTFEFLIIMERLTNSSSHSSVLVALTVERVTTEEGCYEVGQDALLSEALQKGVPSIV